jgi:hypothetical protein
MRALLLMVLCAGPAGAAEPEILKRFACEPTVAALQRAAARVAELQPERARSWLRRVNAAALLPAVRVRTGRGTLGLQLRGLEGFSPNADTWRFDIEASWGLDRLVFDKNELGVSRESQRLAARREALLTQVAQLYFQRRRLQVEAVQEGETLDRTLAIDELTAILDGLTDGALGRGLARP